MDEFIPPRVYVHVSASQLLIVDDHHQQQPLNNNKTENNDKDDDNYTNHESTTGIEQNEDELEREVEHVCRLSSAPCLLSPSSVQMQGSGTRILFQRGCVRSGTLVHKLGNEAWDELWQNGTFWLLCCTTPGVTNKANSCRRDVFGDGDKRDGESLLDYFVGRLFQASPTLMVSVIKWSEFEKEEENRQRHSSEAGGEFTDAQALTNFVQAALGDVNGSATFHFLLVSITFMDPKSERTCEVVLASVSAAVSGPPSRTTIALLAVRSWFANIASTPLLHTRREQDLDDLLRNLKSWVSPVLPPVLTGFLFARLCRWRGGEDTRRRSAAKPPKIIYALIEALEESTEVHHDTIARHLSFWSSLGALVVDEDVQAGDVDDGKETHAKEALINGTKEKHDLMHQNGNGSGGLWCEARERFLLLLATNPTITSRILMQQKQLNMQHPPQHEKRCSLVVAALEETHRLAQVIRHKALQRHIRSLFAQNPFSSPPPSLFLLTDKQRSQHQGGSATVTSVLDQFAIEMHALQWCQRLEWRYYPLIVPLLLSETNLTTQAETTSIPTNLSKDQRDVSVKSSHATVRSLSRGVLLRGLMNPSDPLQRLAEVETLRRLLIQLHAAHVLQSITLLSLQEAREWPVGQAEKEQQAFVLRQQENITQWLGRLQHYVHQHHEVNANILLLSVDEKIQYFTDVTQEYLAEQQRQHVQEVEKVQKHLSQLQEETCVKEKEEHKVEKSELLEKQDVRDGQVELWCKKRKELEHQQHEEHQLHEEHQQQEEQKHLNEEEQPHKEKQQQHDEPFVPPFQSGCTMDAMQTVSTLSEASRPLTPAHSVASDAPMQPAMEEVSSTTTGTMHTPADNATAWPSQNEESGAEMPACSSVADVNVGVGATPQLEPPTEALTSPKEPSLPLTSPIAFPEPFLANNQEAPRPILPPPLSVETPQVWPSHRLRRANMAATHSPTCRQLLSTGGNPDAAQRRRKAAGRLPALSFSDITRERAGWRSTSDLDDYRGFMAYNVYLVGPAGGGKSTLAHCLSHEPPLFARLPTVGPHTMTAQHTPTRILDLTLSQEPIPLGGYLPSSAEARRLGMGNSPKVVPCRIGVNIIEVATPILQAASIGHVKFPARGTMYIIVYRAKDDWEKTRQTILKHVRLLQSAIASLSPHMMEMLQSDKDPRAGPLQVPIILLGTHSDTVTEWSNPDEMCAAQEWLHRLDVWFGEQMRSEEASEAAGMGLPKPYLVDSFLTSALRTRVIGCHASSASSFRGLLDSIVRFLHIVAPMSPNHLVSKWLPKKWLQCCAPKQMQTSVHIIADGTLEGFWSTQLHHTRPIQSGTVNSMNGMEATESMDPAQCKFLEWHRSSVSGLLVLFTALQRLRQYVSCSFDEQSLDNAVLYHLGFVRPDDPDESPVDGEHIQQSQSAESDSNNCNHSNTNYGDRDLKGSLLRLRDVLLEAVLEECRLRGLLLFLPLSSSSSSSPSAADSNRQVATRMVLVGPQWIEGIWAQTLAPQMIRHHVVSSTVPSRHLREVLMAVLQQCEKQLGITLPIEYFTAVWPQLAEEIGGKGKSVENEEMRHDMMLYFEKAHVTVPLLQLLWRSPYAVLAMDRAIAAMSLQASGLLAMETEEQDVDNRNLSSTFHLPCIATSSMETV